MTRAPDPIVALEHDHSHLAELVQALRDVLRAARQTGPTSDIRGELVDSLRVLQDDLFSHFALEEEGLFPTVIAELPDIERLVADVVASHDRLCGAVSRMMHTLDRGPADFPAGLENLCVLFHRFDEAYTAHARDELELLRTLDRRLDARQRALVGRLLKEL